MATSTEFNFSGINFKDQKSLDLFETFIQYATHYEEIREDDTASEKKLLRALEHLELSYKYLKEEGVIDDKKVKDKVLSTIKNKNLSDVLEE